MGQFVAKHPPLTIAGALTGLVLLGCTGIVSDGDSFGLNPNGGSGPGASGTGNLPGASGSGEVAGSGNQGGAGNSTGSSGSGGANNASGSNSGGTSGTAGGTSSGTGIPCDVAQVLSTRCVSCHGSPPLIGVPMSLVSYADLTAPSKSDPNQSALAMSIARMRNAAIPMPPGGGISAAELAAFDTWQSAGAPRTDCGSTGTGGAGGTTGAGGASGSGSGGTAGSGATGSNSGLPCDVAQMLASSCLTCHGAPPIAGVPMSLVSYADLTGPSRSNSSLSNAQLSVTRMSSTTAPMPPGVGATSAQISVLQNWINAGTPFTNCDGGVVVPPDPFNTPVTCTSGQTIGGGESATMLPGQACISCHRNGGGEAPTFVLAGTVYPTAHEPNNCSGGSTVSGTQVIVTGANGQTVTMTANSSGNFYSATRVTTPYTASIVYQGRTRAMATPQTNGDCNSCHTVSGTSGAPGRIMRP